MALLPTHIFTNIHFFTFLNNINSNLVEAKYHCDFSLRSSDGW